MVMSVVSFLRLLQERKRLNRALPFRQKTKSLHSLSLIASACHNPLNSRPATRISPATIIYDRPELACSETEHVMFRTKPIDEQQIFHARCRGFTRKEATRMIASGFFQQIFDRIPIESVRKALAAAIARQVREYE